MSLVMCGGRGCEQPQMGPAAGRVLVPLVLGHTDHHLGAPAAAQHACRGV